MNYFATGGTNEKNIVFLGQCQTKKITLITFILHFQLSQKHCLVQLDR
ncbi:hypothetical protein PPRY_b1074 [Pseudoalteromonas prydzensis ACAM 620]|nr:hypothetical protein [Pseudoalteromonas prydzensis ACAM 620]